MFAAGPTSEVVAGQQNTRLARTRLVQGEVGFGRAVGQVTPTLLVVFKKRAGMIWSVSIFSIGMTTIRLVNVLNGFIICPHRDQELGIGY
jgi:hypothetical protein